MLMCRFSWHPWQTRLQWLLRKRRAGRSCAIGAPAGAGWGITSRQEVIAEPAGKRCQLDAVNLLASPPATATHRARRADTLVGFCRSRLAVGLVQLLSTKGVGRRPGQPGIIGHARRSSRASNITSPLADHVRRTDDRRTKPNIARCRSCPLARTGTSYRRRAIAWPRRHAPQAA